MSDQPIEYEFLQQAMCALDASGLETEIETEHFMENMRVRVTLHTDAEILEHSALGVVYALGALSFHDARPRGNSGMEYAERDNWNVADMLRYVTFPGGRVYFYADYVRGRMMKTSVEIFSTGRIVLETQNRGEAATRWVQKLQGKKVMSLVNDEAEREETDDES